MTSSGSANLCSQLFTNLKKEDVYKIGRCIKRIFLSYSRFLHGKLHTVINEFSTFLAFGLETKSTPLHKQVMGQVMVKRGTRGANLSSILICGRTSLQCDGALEQVTQRCCGASYGDTQDSSRCLPA